MDFERINVDADKTSDSTGDSEDGKQLVDPLEFVEVKTEAKVSYSFFHPLSQSLFF
jgi:hypothetical protein